MQLTHPRAEEFLRRDVRRVSDFFASKGAKRLLSYPRLYAFIVDERGGSEEAPSGASERCFFPPSFPMVDLFSTIYVSVTVLFDHTPAFGFTINCEVRCCSLCLSLSLSFLMLMFLHAQLAIG